MPSENVVNYENPENKAPVIPKASDRLQLGYQYPWMNPKYFGYKPELFQEKMNRMLQEGLIPVRYDKPLSQQAVERRDIYRKWKDQEYFREYFGRDQWGQLDKESDWYKMMYPDKVAKAEEPLPPGAIRRDAYGNPQYGTDWWSDIKNRIDAQVKEMNKKYISKDQAFSLDWNAPKLADVGKVEGAGEKAKYLFSGAVQGVEGAMRESSEVNQYFIAKIGARPIYNQAVGALKKLGWGILGASDQLNHRFWGFWATLGNRLATGTPWSEQTPEWMSNYNKMVMSGQWETTDYILKPETWAGFWQEANQVSDVIMGNIWDGLGAKFSGEDTTQPGLRIAEYLRAAKEVPAEDLYSLQRDINNPVGDILGMPTDPLNLVQAGAGSLLKGFRTWNATRYATKLLPEAEAIFDGVDVFRLAGAGDDVVDAAKQANIVEGIIKDTGFIRTKLTATAERNLPWDLTNGAKAQELGNETMALFSWVASKTNGDPDEIFELLGHVAKVASDEPAVVEDAFRAVSGSMDDWGYLMTEPGRKAAVNLYDLMKGGEVENIAKIVTKNFEEGKNLENFAKMVEKFDEMAHAVAKDKFPTILDAVKEGRQIPKWAHAALKTYDWLQNSKFGYKAINKFFSDVYLGYSPGYAVRNGIQNTVQTILDEGISGVTKSYRSADETMEWLGATRSGEHWLGGDDLFQMKKEMTSMNILDAEHAKGGAKPWYKRNALDAGAHLENKARIGIFRKKIPETMRGMLRKNVRKSLIKDLGFDADTARNIERRLIAKRGNVKAVIDEFRGMYKTGTRNIVGMDQVDQALLNKLNEFDGLTAELDDIIDAGIKNNRTVDEVIAEMTDVRDAWLKKARADVAREIPTPAVEDVNRPLHGVNNEISGEIATDLENGVISRDLKDSIQNFINVNIRVNREVGKVLDMVSRHIKWDIYDQVGRVDTLLDQQWENLLKSVKIAMPEEFGGGYMDGWDYFTNRRFGQFADEAVSGIKSDWDKAIDGLADEPAKVDVFWKTSGMEGKFGPLPAGMPWQEARKSMINEKWLDIKNYGEAWRDQNYAMSRMWVDEVQRLGAEAGAKTIKDPNTMFAVVDRVMERAKYMDKFLPRRFVQEQIKRGKRLISKGHVTQGNKELALAYARHYGISTATGTGVPMDQYIVNILNKQLGRKFTDINSLRAVTSEELEVALFNHAVGVGKTMIDQPEVTKSILEKIATSAKLTHDESLQKNLIIDLIADDDPELAQRWGEAIYSRGMFNEQEAAKTAEDLAKFTDDVKNADNTLQSLTDQVAEKLYSIQEDTINRVVSGDDWAKAPLPEWGGSTTPAHGRAIWENRQGFVDSFNQVEDYLRRSWGATQTVDTANNVEILKRLDEAEKLLGGMVGTSRRVAQRVAEVTANFVLHDYGRKRNFDLFLGLIYPYSFWYTRTYANWVQRIVRQPGTVQAYVKFKAALGEINKDMPEWYRYNFNSNMIPGINSENPLFANLEAAINPLYGILGVNFNDPDKRKTQFARFLDDLGKNGPSIYSPFAIAYGWGLYLQGEKEAGSKWMSRLLPQTRFFRALTSSLGVNEGRGIETDPNLVLQSIIEGRGLGGGMDPYERPRVARALYGMVETGVLTQEQAEQAAQEGWDNPDFRLAVAHAQGARNLGDFVSFFGIPNMRTRTAEDLEIDKIDQARQNLYKMRDWLSPDEFAEEQRKIYKQYPAFNIVTMARKDGIDRDMAYTYSVLRRLPPGNRDPFYEIAGVDKDALQEFYDSKGKVLETWDKPTRDRFMAGVIEMGTVLALPDDVTRLEWDAAQKAYSDLEDRLKTFHGESVVGLDETYFAMLGEDKDKAYAWLDAHPEYRAYQNDRNSLMNIDPLLRKYYNSYVQGKSMYNSMMYQELEAKFPDGAAMNEAYWTAVDLGQKPKAPQELKDYWAFKNSLKEMFALRLKNYEKWMPEAGDVSAFLRPDQPEEPTKVQKALSEVQLDKTASPEAFNYTWDEWKQLINNQSLSNLVEDWAFRGAPLSKDAEQSLEYALKDSEIPIELARYLMREAIQQTGAQFYSENNPPWWLQR